MNEMIERLTTDPKAVERLLTLLIRYQYDVPAELRKEIMGIVYKKS